MQKIYSIRSLQTYINLYHRHNIIYSNIFDTHSTHIRAWLFCRFILSSDHLRLCNCSPYNVHVRSLSYWVYRFTSFARCTLIADLFASVFTDISACPFCIDDISGLRETFLYYSITLSRIDDVAAEEAWETRSHQRWRRGFPLWRWSSWHQVQCRVTNGNRKDGLELHCCVIEN